MAKKKQEVEEGFAEFKPYFSKMRVDCHGKDGSTIDIKPGACGNHGVPEEGFLVDQESELCASCFEAAGNGTPLIIFNSGSKHEKCAKCKSTGIIDDESGWCESCFETINGVAISINGEIKRDGAPVKASVVEKRAVEDLDEEEFYYMKEINREIDKALEHIELCKKSKAKMSEEEYDENIEYLKELVRAFPQLPHKEIPDKIFAKRKVKNVVVRTEDTLVKLDNLSKIDQEIKEGLEDFSDMDWFVSPVYDGVKVIIDVASGKMKSILYADQEASENMLSISKKVNNFPTFKNITAKLKATFCVKRGNKQSAAELVESLNKSNKKDEKCDSLFLIITGIVDRIEIDGFYEDFETEHTMYDRLAQRGMTVPAYKVLRHYSKIQEYINNYEEGEFTTTDIRLRPDELFIDKSLKNNFNFYIRYNAQAYSSKVTGLEFYKNRSLNKLTPRAVIEQVTVKDIDYTRAVINDLKFADNIMIGDVLDLELAGGVMFATAINMEKRTAACTKPPAFDGKCPSCGGACAVDDGALVCKNDKCVDILYRKVKKHAESQEVLKRWADDAFLDPFFTSTQVKSLDEILQLDANKIKKVPGVGTKRAEKIVEDIKAGFKGMDQAKLMALSA